MSNLKDALEMILDIISLIKIIFKMKPEMEKLKKWAKRVLLAIIGKQVIETNDAPLVNTGYITIGKEPV
jgi:hypothetical protein